MAKPKKPAKKAKKAFKKKRTTPEPALVPPKAQPLRCDGPPVVGILTGSRSDLPIVSKAVATLDELDIPCDVRVLSAHRTPARTAAYVRAARDNGLEVLIACAGMAAHLAGVVAAHTTLPVIGVPLASGPLQGVDALLATVQMPSGIPVATVGVDGTRNAAFLAARILAATHPEIHDRLEAYREASLERYDDIDISKPGLMRRSKK